MTLDLDRFIERRNSNSVKWCHYDADVLPLWVADMDFVSPQPVLQALRERVEHGVFGYGSDPQELRQVFVQRMERLYGWRVSPEALVFVPGVVVAFNQACHALTAPGDGILVQTPVYPPIHTAPANCGCTLDAMQLTQQPDGTYAVDWDAFEQAITPRTQVFLLCSPHNPVGRVFRRDELESMARICLEKNLVICSDDIHCDLLFSGQQHIPIASLAPEIEARTITLMAPSKTYNIAGLDCSVAIIPNADLRKRFLTARAGLVPGVNILGYVAALAAYRDGQPWLEQVLRYLEGNRDMLLQYVRDHMPRIRVGKPEGTYLTWLDCRQAGIPGNPYEFFLKEARVALNDGKAFGAGGEGFVRLNLACTRATLEDALQRMRGVLP